MVSLWSRSQSSRPLRPPTLASVTGLAGSEVNCSRHNIYVAVTSYELLSLEVLPFLQVLYGSLPQPSTFRSLVRIP